MKLSSPPHPLPSPPLPFPSPRLSGSARCVRSRSPGRQRSARAPSGCGRAAGQKRPLRSVPSRAPCPRHAQSLPGEAPEPAAGGAQLGWAARRGESRHLHPRYGAGGRRPAPGAAGRKGGSGDPAVRGGGDMGRELCRAGAAPRGRAAASRELGETRWRGHGQRSGEKSPGSGRGASPAGSCRPRAWQNLPHRGAPGVGGAGSWGEMCVGVQEGGKPRLHEKSAWGRRRKDPGRGGRMMYSWPPPQLLLPLLLPLPGV